MTKFNLILVTLVIGCALAVVTAQNSFRKVFVELQQQQAQSRQADVEWDQLQLEQSTWAVHTRIEKIATRTLQMRVPDMEHIKLIPVDAARGVNP